MLEDSGKESSNLRETDLPSMLYPVTNSIRYEDSLEIFQKWKVEKNLSFVYPLEASARG